MAKVYAFLADGLEEVECLAVVDVLRRAGIETTLISIQKTELVTGAHGIRLLCDKTIDEIPELNAADVLFLPGGMPGTTHLMECDRLMEAILHQINEGKRLAAICAAPSVLGKAGVLKGKRATCYPGFEECLTGATHVPDGVVTDGMVTTARGLGYALDLGIELVHLLISGEKAKEIKTAIQYDQIP